MGVGEDVPKNTGQPPKGRGLADGGLKPAGSPIKIGLQGDPKQRILHCPGTRKLQRE